MSSALVGFTLRRTRHDVAMGVGLVAVSCLLMATTVPMLDGATIEAARAAMVLSVGAFAAALGSAAVLWHRTCRSCLVVFPLLVVVSVTVLAAVSERVAVYYGGLFTLALVYLGLTQRGRTVLVCGVVAAPLWWFCQPGMSPSILVRSGVTLLIWVAVGVGLAHVAGRSRADAADLLRRATTDGLTGLGSRVALTAAIDSELEAETSASLLLFDLDGFKGVNDMFGHAAGDHLLIEIARRIGGVFRHRELAARLGGDEFAVLLPGTGVDQAARAAHRLLDVLAEPVVLERGPMAVTASVGVSSLDGITAAEAAIRQADLAMYESKQGGRNRVSIFRQELRDRRDAQEELEADLRLALERGEFELHYQPLVHLQTEDVIGTEAFLRWNHPRHGLLTPDRFLATCQAIHCHTALGGWVLQEACRQAVQWQPSDPARVVTMAVNVSAPEVLAPGFVGRVEAALDGAGLNPGLLVLEISERLAVSDAPSIRHRIDELRQLGVRIAIDDFGTGYLSLTDLRDLPIDAVKIDNSLVRPLGHDTRANALVRSMVAVAEALDLDVVVEGVETETQVSVLKDLGCQVAQGYRFARPATAETITHLLVPQLRGRARTSTAIRVGAGPLQVGTSPGRS